MSGPIPDTHVPPINLPYVVVFFVQAEDVQQQIIRETFHLVSKRDDNVCNFLEGGTYVISDIAVVLGFVFQSS